MEKYNLEDFHCKNNTRQLKRKFGELDINPKDYENDGGLIEFNIKRLKLNNNSVIDKQMTHLALNTADNTMNDMTLDARTELEEKYDPIDEQQRVNEYYSKQNKSLMCYILGYH